MKPNLFKYATSELSQDAFICWLLSWAKPKNKASNEKLGSVALNLLRLMFKKHGKTFPGNVGELEIIKQHHDIDVYLEINKKYAVIIEDKVHTKSHSGQLAKYLKKIQESDHINKEDIIPIYFKTGDQGRYDHEREKGYKILNRADLLQLLKDGEEKEIKNNIYNDYLEHLQEIEEAVQLFRSKPVTDWKYPQWIGFFKYLQQELDPDKTKNCNWNYTSNWSGGFMGFWWYSHNDGESSQYLQIEEDKLCFKIEVQEKEKRKDLKWHWHQTFMEAADLLDIPVVKPKRLASGRWMTVAVYNSRDRDTWIVEDGNSINLEETIEVLSQVENVLLRAVNN